MSREKLVNVNDPQLCMLVYKNVGCQGKSGPGKIHEVILVNICVYVSIFCVCM